jgi:hypothetical protein
MSEVNDVEVIRVADQIEGYLESRPHAADTLEGITQWWLLGQGVDVSSLVVLEALNYLSLKSVVKCNANLNGNKVYSSNKVKAEYQSK